MSYNNNIPQPTELISTSQGQILGNFAAIDNGTTGTGNGFCRNHVTMTDGTNGGLHNRVDYYQPVSDPSVIGFTASLYVKSIVEGALPSANQLFYNNGSAPYPLTGAISAASTGYVYLPGGILLKWGSFTSAAGNSSFEFPRSSSIPVFSSIFQVFLQPSNASGSPDYFGYITTFDVTKFMYDSVARRSPSGASGNYSYLAIGT